MATSKLFFVVCIIVPTAAKEPGGGIGGPERNLQGWTPAAGQVNHTFLGAPMGLHYNQQMGHSLHQWTEYHDPRKPHVGWTPPPLAPICKTSFKYQSTCQAYGPAAAFCQWDGTTCRQKVGMDAYNKVCHYRCKDHQANCPHLFAGLKNEQTVSRMCQQLPRWTLLAHKYSDNYGACCIDPADPQIFCKRLNHCQGGSTQVEHQHERWQIYEFDCTSCDGTLKKKCCETCNGVRNNPPAAWKVTPDQVTCLGCIGQATLFNPSPKCHWVDKKHEQLTCADHDKCNNGKKMCVGSSWSTDCKYVPCKSRCGRLEPGQEHDGRASAQLMAACCKKCLENVCRDNYDDDMPQYCEGCDEVNIFEHLVTNRTVDLDTAKQATSYNTCPIGMNKLMFNYTPGEASIQCHNANLSPRRLSESTMQDSSKTPMPRDCSTTPMPAGCPQKLAIGWIGTEISEVKTVARIEHMKDTNVMVHFTTPLEFLHVAGEDIFEPTSPTLRNVQQTEIPLTSSAGSFAWTANCLGVLLLSVVCICCCAWCGHRINSKVKVDRYDREAQQGPVVESEQAKDMEAEDTVTPLLPQRTPMGSGEASNSEEQGKRFILKSALSALK